MADTRYEFAGRMGELYHLLKDELSQKVFWARLQHDYTASVDDTLRLFSLTGMLSEEEIAVQFTWKNVFSQLSQENKKIILYGAGTCGILVGKAILNSCCDFWGFCDRNAGNMTANLLDKPVIEPEFLLKHSDESYVIITAMEYSQEIYDTLVKNGFPETHILPYFNKLGTPFSKLLDNQYFEFPMLYPKGTAFVDGGCYDCKNSIRFAEWCAGAYSKIFAFEPDPQNFRNCQAIAKENSIARIILFQAGLSDCSGVKSFFAGSNSDSCIVDENKNSADGRVNTRSSDEIQNINVLALDSVVGDTTVGFIKLDIEGVEYSALQGARQTILRDKPFLAVSVYHQAGDVLAIMDYLHELIPEYRFWLRHYSSVGCDTVLYASL